MSSELRKDVQGALSSPGAVEMAPSLPGASAEEVLRNISIQGMKTHEFLKKDNIYPFQGEIWASSEQQCKRKRANKLKKKIFI